MAPTYDSKALGQVVSFSDVSKLDKVSLDMLKEELEVAIKNMQIKINREIEQGPDPDWLHRIQFKKKLCSNFLEKIEIEQDFDHVKFEAIHLMYLRQKLKAILGPLEGERLYQEARNVALAHFNK
tara:strand:+ start:60 stop:434 length:375 start_codon:yes stop_codon:yes gene_type:complete